MSALEEQVTGPLVVSDPIQVDDELWQLCHLRAEDLREALRGGVLARSICTENDPPYYPGATFHGVTTRSLRDQVLPQGWTKNDAGGYSRTVSPDGGIALVVATGDEWTAKYDPENSLRQPKTVQRKGPLTAAVVRENEIQYEFDGMAAVLPMKRAARTWVFLIHYAGEAGAVAELSLPREMDAESRIAAWRKRIIIVPPDDATVDPTRREMPKDEGFDFEVEVAPRVG